MTEAFKVIAGKPTITKDPNARLDYYERWGTWLGDDTIVTATTPTVSGVTVDEANIINAGVDVQLWLTGGVLGETGSVTVHIVTAAGREDDRTLYFKIRSR